MKNYINKESGNLWQPAYFSPDERSIILTHIRDMGKRLQDRSQVLKMAQIAAHQSKYNIWALHGYRSQSLALGPLGLALAYNELDQEFPQEGWFHVAQTYFSLLPDKLTAEGHYAFGLFSGLSGILFVTHRLMRVNDQYKQIYRRLVSLVCSIAGKYNAANDQPEPVIYNLTSGAIGIGYTLLILATSQTSSEISQELLEQLQKSLSQLVHHLVWIGGQNEDSSWKFENRYINATMREFIVHDRAKARALSGYGLRQGIAGLVAFLSLVCINDTGIRTDFVLEAIRELCKQLQQGLLKEERGKIWPQIERGDEYHPVRKYVTFGWCDGAVGIARALWLASRALHDEALGTQALEIIYDIGQRLWKMPASIGPSLCHGWAGILQTYAHFASETREPALQEQVRIMTNHLLTLFEEDRPFGYREIEPEYTRVDSPWLMNGAAGVVLVLLSVISEQKPTWDRILLLH